MGVPRIGIYIWNQENQKYRLKERDHTTTANQYRSFRIVHMEKDRFNEKDTDIWIIQTEENFQPGDPAKLPAEADLSGRSIFQRFRLNFQTLKDSGRYHLKTPNQRIIGFHQYTCDDFVIV